MYFITPNYSIAMIPKAGCSTIGASILYSFYPDIYKENYKIRKPVYLKNFVPNEPNPSKQTVLFVRHPIERFISAISSGTHIHVPIEEIIQAFENNDKMCGLPYLRKQINWKKENSIIHRFPEDLPLLITKYGFKTYFHINENLQKREINKNHLDKVFNHYQDDFLLYN
jgi:hypothetical protein